MRLIKFIRRLFKIPKSSPDPFAEAIASGIQETFKEMGYRVNGKDKT